MGCESVRRQSRRWPSRRWAWIPAGLLVAVALALLLPGGELLRVLHPREHEVVGLAGVELMVRYPDQQRVAPDTLRVLLNGADVSEHIVRGANGAYGRLYGVLDGPNVLRVEVFGRRWWLPGVLVEEAREVRFLVRLPQDLDRG